MDRRMGLLTVVLSLLILACEPGATTETTTSDTSGISTLASGRSEFPGATERFEPASCDLILSPVGGPANDAICGFVSVPLDHADPGGPEIRIALSFVDNGIEGPPVMAFLGGPGVGGAGLVGSFVGAPFPALMMDERGTGASEPSLDCPEVEAGFEQGLVEPYFDELGEERFRTALQQCHDRLVGDGVELGLFASDQSALDIGLVHRALGFDEVTILGISYGTRLALTKLRDDPVGVRGVILDSPVPLDWEMFEALPTNATAAVAHLAEACADDEVCNQTHGDLMTNLTAAVDRLRSEPVTITATRISGDEVEVLVDEDRFLSMVFGAMYETETIPMLPGLVFRVGEGDMDALTTLGDLYIELIDPSIPFSTGMATSVLCHEEAPFNDLSKLADAVDPADQIFDPQEFLGQVPPCEIWVVPAAGPIEDDPVFSEVPALILAGAFDPITPASNANQLATELANSTLVIHPAGGHGSAPTSQCTLGIVDAFIADPSATLDTSCVATMTGPVFTP